MRFSAHTLRVWMLAAMICLPVSSEEPLEFIELEGIIEPSEVVAVSSPVPGVLSEVLVERGDFVKKGQVLVRLVSGVEQAAVKLAQARTEFGKRKLERNEELYRKELISVNDKDELSTEVNLSELQENEAAERLKLRTISSTIDGVIMERLGSAGEYVGEKPFLTLAKINPLNVEVVVPVEHLGLITKGMAATVIPEAPVGGEFPVKVVIVDHVVDAASGTFGVRLALSNPDNTLHAGIKCRVRFTRKD
ncbi:MAG: efflux RND transporter periplasmic adaptor subunit [Desulfobacteraceae bacterium]|nr:efflux RND transporter periplasmic adaptor subunit [Desulfobacteraceae bacterium]